MYTSYALDNPGMNIVMRENNITPQHCVRITDQHRVNITEIAAR